MLRQEDSSVRIKKALRAGPLTIPQLRDRLGLCPETIRRLLRSFGSEVEERKIGRTYSYSLKGEGDANS